MNLCTVARHGHTATAEIDDLAKAKAMGLCEFARGPAIAVSTG
jgi:hypothetical protein